MPYVLIKYAHVFICIWVGKGSQHFNAFHCVLYPLISLVYDGYCRYRWVSASADEQLQLRQHLLVFMTNVRNVTYAFSILMLHLDRSI